MKRSDQNENASKSAATDNEASALSPSLETFGRLDSTPVGFPSRKRTGKATPGQGTPSDLSRVRVGIPCERLSGRSKGCGPNSSEIGSLAPTVRLAAPLMPFRHRSRAGKRR